MRKNNDDNLKFHAQKKKTLYRSYHLLVFHGTDHIRLMKLSKSGNFKKAKSTLLRSPGPIIKVENDYKYKTGCLILVARKNELKDTF